MTVPACCLALLLLTRPAARYQRQSSSSVSEAGMILLQVRIPIALACRSEVLGSLRQIMGETRAWPGCLNCHLCMDVEEGTLLVLMEEWADMQSLRDHVRSDSFRVVLSALDYASKPPEVRFDTIASSRGMEFILACRQAGAPS
jgi:quinol monooxygenase YgiN